MTGWQRNVRQTLTVARRDFVATVMTPTFLIFLLAPLLMVGFGAIGGMGAASVSQGSMEQARLVAVVPAAQGARMVAVDKDLRNVFRKTEGPPELVIDTPQADPAAETERQFARKDIDVSAVMTGTLERPTITYGPQGKRGASYLAELAEQTLRAERVGPGRLSVATSQPLKARDRTTGGGRNQAAFFAVLGIFMLSLMLTSQSVGVMAEEKSSKVIEVLAAAVPLESVFLGKLIGMFGVALLFVAFWGTILVSAAQYAPPDMIRAFSEVGPAVGAPTFVLLFLLYFTMAYLLLGAVFLGVGAQASTMREIQMLSLPITFFQVGMMSLSIAASSRPGSWIATAAEIFPFSSPFAMAARAANRPEFWPHLLALGWQLLWVGLTVTIAARLFRRGVLQSGQPRRRKRGAAAAA